MSDFNTIQAMPLGIDSEEANKAKEILQSFDWNTYNKLLFVSAALFRVSEVELINTKNVNRDIVTARHLYWFSIHKVMDKGIGEVARYFNTDKTTISYGINAIKEKIKTNKSIAEKWKMLQKMV